ncbi:hypothetical protein GC194_06530 [bacterium]|nr:hypothetical protein [bacterium]
MKYLPVFTLLLMLQLANAQDTTAFRVEVDTPQWLSLKVYDSLMRAGELEYRVYGSFIGGVACLMRNFEKYNVEVDAAFSDAEFAEYMVFNLSVQDFNKRLFVFLEKKYGKRAIEKLKRNISLCTQCGCKSIDSVFLRGLKFGKIVFEKNEWQLDMASRKTFVNCLSATQQFWEKANVGLELMAYYTGDSDSLLMEKRRNYLVKLLKIKRFDPSLYRIKIIQCERDCDKTSDTFFGGYYYL